MKQRPFTQVDVFTATPYKGNGLAVVHDADDLSTAQMQDFARWTHLSETTFLLTPTHPEADYRVRIFTPGGELPFAGHPTLGTCYAFLKSGGRSRKDQVVVQQSAVGLVTVKKTADHTLAFAAPSLTAASLTSKQYAQVLAALGLAHEQVLASQMLNNGPLWCCLWLDSSATVLALQPDHRALKAFGVMVGVAAAHNAANPKPPTAQALIARSNREARAFHSVPTIEVRAFTAPAGMDEDPVTGSLNASLAQWLMGAGYLPESYVAVQGTAIGSEGRVSLDRDPTGQVWVGGAVQDGVQGSVWL
jgi:PhzF family phenazine biosynthesis protein